MMKRLIIKMALAMTISFSALIIAPAQTPPATPPASPTALPGTQVKVAEVATWLTSKPVDWTQGILYAVLGLTGALITLFSLVGGTVPGTAGQANIDASTQQLDRLSKRLEELISANPVQADVVAAVNTAVDRLRDDLRSEVWRQYLLAAFIYAILGAFISALLAKDLLQAIIIGAGWTGFLGSLGLKSDFAQRKAIKDSALEDSLTLIRQAQQASANQSSLTQQPTGPASLTTSLPFHPEKVEHLEHTVRVAQSL